MQTNLDASSLKCLFDTEYDGYPARKVTNQPNANRFMDFLIQKQVSYRLKILRKPANSVTYLFQLVGGSQDA